MFGFYHGHLSEGRLNCAMGSAATNAQFASGVGLGVEK